MNTYQPVQFRENRQKKQVFALPTATTEDEQATYASPTAEADIFLADAIAYCNSLPKSPTMKRQYVGVEKMKACLLERAKIARINWHNSKCLRALPVQRKWKAKIEMEVVLDLISAFKYACN